MKRRMVMGCVVLVSMLVAGHARSAGWEAVRVTSAGSDGNGCQFVKSVHGEIDTFWGGGTEKLYNMLRKRADAVGANLVVLIGGVTTVKLQNGTRLLADGEAYRCGASAGITSVSKEEPPSDPLAAELLALERASFKAALTKDMAALTKGIADDAKITVDGKTYTKAEYLASVMKFQLPDMKGAEVKSEHADAKARTNGEFAEYTATVTHVIEGSRGRVPFEVGMERSRYKKAEERWVLVESEWKTISKVK